MNTTNVGCLQSLRYSENSSFCHWMSLLFVVFACVLISFSVIFRFFLFSLILLFLWWLLLYCCVCIYRGGICVAWLISFRFGLKFKMCARFASTKYQQFLFCFSIRSPDQKHFYSLYRKLNDQREQNNKATSCTAKKQLHK